MPANSKHLTVSKWKRFVKIITGFIGGFLLSAGIHIILAKIFDASNIIITSGFTFFLLWVTFFIIAFLVENIWKVLGIYLMFILICMVLIFL